MDNGKQKEGSYNLLKLNPQIYFNNPRIFSPNYKKI